MEKCTNEGFDVEESCYELQCRKMDSCGLNSILHELFEEKISTQKKNHWILGPEDLNDTLVYDFELEAA